MALQLTTISDTGAKHKFIRLQGNWDEVFGELSRLETIGEGYEIIATHSEIGLLNVLTYTLTIICKND